MAFSARSVGRTAIWLLLPPSASLAAAPSNRWWLLLLLPLPPPPLLLRRARGIFAVCKASSFSPLLGEKPVAVASLLPPSGKLIARSRFGRTTTTTTIVSSEEHTDNILPQCNVLRVVCGSFFSDVMKFLDLFITLRLAETPVIHLRVAVVVSHMAALTESEGYYFGREFLIFRHFFSSSHQESRERIRRQRLKPLSCLPTRLARGGRRVTV